MYELYDNCTVMFFYRYGYPSGPTDSRNKHIMIDLGTGNNNKMCAFHAPFPPATR